MRRTLRILGGVLTGVSLVMATVVALLWVRSTMGPLPIVVDHQSSQTRFWTTHQHGTLSIHWREIQPLPNGTWEFTGNHVNVRLTDPQPNWLGLGWNTQPTGPSPPGTGQWIWSAGYSGPAANNNGQWARAGAISLPYWLLLMVFVSGPLFWWLRHRRPSQSVGFDVLPKVHHPELKQ